MNTKYIKVEILNNSGTVLTDESLAGLAAAGKIIKSGGLAAFPTETVYGLGGDALNPDSSRKIYAAKGRPSDNPLIVHIADINDLFKITVNVPDKALLLAERFWPGPLTMIFHKSAAVPFETTGGLETVAVRMPDNEAALELIRQSGGFIAAPSANISGRPSPTKAAHVKEDMDGRIDMIIDGGDSLIGLESTIVDMTEETPIILRPGYITINSLSRVVGDVIYDPAILDADSKTAPRAPGMKYRHYAPKGDLTIVKGEKDAVVEFICDAVEKALSQGKKAGIIATEETFSVYKDTFHNLVGNTYSDKNISLSADIVNTINYPKSDGTGVSEADNNSLYIRNIGSRNDEAEIARRLYGVLREFDDCDADIIYSEEFDTPDIGQAIMNRLIKAAGHSIIGV